MKLSFRMAENQTMAGGKAYTYFFTPESSVPLMRSGHAIELSTQLERNSLKRAIVCWHDVWVLETLLHDVGHRRIYAIAYSLCLFLLHVHWVCLYQWLNHFFLWEI